MVAAELPPPARPEAEPDRDPRTIVRISVIAGIPGPVISVAIPPGPVVPVAIPPVGPVIPVAMSPVAAVIRAELGLRSRLVGLESIGAPFGRDGGARQRQGRQQRERRHC